MPDPVGAAHRAVAGLFVLNAVAFANVVPRLPAIKADLDLSNAALGSAVAAMALGALVSGPAAGVLVARFGSARLATACGVGFGLVVPFFGIASSWWALAATFLVLGLLDSWMDVSMNAHALRVQRAMGRSIINTLHGTWSIGAVVGGVAGTVAAAAGVSVGVQVGVAGAVIVAATLVVRPFLLEGPDDADREAPSEEVDAAADRRAAPRRGWRCSGWWSCSRPSSRTPRSRGVRCSCATSWTPAPAWPASCSWPSRCR